MVIIGSSNEGGKQQALTKDKTVRDEKLKNRHAAQSPWHTAPVSQRSCPQRHLRATLYAYTWVSGKRKGHLTASIMSSKAKRLENLLLGVLRRWRSRVGGRAELEKPQEHQRARLEGRGPVGSTASCRGQRCSCCPRPTPPPAQPVPAAAKGGSTARCPGSKMRHSISEAGKHHFQA